ncbi:hypothetical protein MSG28_008729 [Choristoneura fumiferana]|uniref:Uncharacterized protein n=1 Tax=Choristoneura fumiferana TaxID=7141 RepID=A0ACC0J7Y3_CHOFU|nr:hypothetical protein MSG28_008729 [Choristoneura fumiferana]
MKRSLRLLKIAREGYKDDEKRKRLTIPSPVPPGSEPEIAYLMECFGGKLNEADENKSPNITLEKVNSNGKKIMDNSPVKEIYVVAAEVHAP